MFTQLTTTLTLLCLIFGTNLAALSMPVYTDEIPQEHLNKFNSSTKKLIEPEIIEEFTSEQEVKIYSDKKIMPITILKKVDGEKILSQNILINDKVNFYVAKDVYKNDKIYIKKGEIVTGIVSKAEAVVPNISAPGELQIQNFQTKTVKGYTIKLYGKIENIGHEFGLIGWLLGIGNYSTSGYVKKNKIYTVYYK